MKLVEMRFKPDIVAMSLEILSTNDSNKVPCAAYLLSLLVNEFCATAVLKPHFSPLRLNQIVAFVSNFHKLEEMGFAVSRIKQALLLYENDSDIQKPIACVLSLPLSFSSEPAVTHAKAYG